MGKLTSPIPTQSEIFPVDETALISEFRATFRNEQAHMPEVSLRYLLWLILSQQPAEEISRFANQVRLDLNEQRLARAVSEYGSLPVHSLNAGSNGLAVGWKNQRL